MVDKSDRNTHIYRQSKPSKRSGFLSCPEQLTEAISKRDQKLKPTKNVTEKTMGSTSTDAIDAYTNTCRQQA